MHGHSYVFAIDTGATVSTIDSSVAARLRLPKAGRPVKLFAAGCRPTAQPVRVTNWSVGGFGFHQRGSFASVWVCLKA